MGILSRLTGSPRERFAAEALRIAQRVPGVASARYDREKFAIAVRRPQESAVAWVYLSNVYGECTGASRAERRDKIERLIRIIATPHAEDTWESARPNLRPVLRAVTFGQIGVAGMVPPISRPAMPHLRELVVIDHPDSMAYVGPNQLDTWSVTVDEVFDVARGNLEHLARGMARPDQPGGKMLIRMIDNGDGYFTSLLLASGWLAEISERAGAQVLAFIPDTTTVVLCDIPSGGVGQLYEIVEKQFVEAVRGLSPVGYVANDRGQVVPYAPPVGDPDHLAARRAEVVLAATEYGAQTEWLTKEYDQAGVEVFVAALMAAVRPGEPAITVTTWTDGITSLLPRAHYISFVRDGAGGIRVPWQAVSELVDLQPEPLLAPARYRVGNWPSPQIMDVLRAHAVD